MLGTINEPNVYTFIIIYTLLLAKVYSLFRYPPPKIQCPFSVQDPIQDSPLYLIIISP